jgi:hypothetical protein
LLVKNSQSDALLVKHHKNQDEDERPIFRLFRDVKMKCVLMGFSSPIRRR